MSIPANPLTAYNTSSHRHMLVAFRSSTAAFAASETINPASAANGIRLDNIDGAVMVLNEQLSDRFTINEAMVDFDFIPHIGVSSSTSVGKIIIADKTAPFAFIDYLRDEILYELNTMGDTQLSLGHVTFMLKTFFDVRSSKSTGNNTDTIQCNPYFFNLESIESIPTGDEPAPTSHILHTMAISNTMGHLRSFSGISQVTITHRDGNVHDTVPEADGSPGILSRADENAKNRANRKTRLDLYKPMLTLKDIFEGLESDLNQQRYTNKAQLQQWQRHIRTHGHVDKIVVAPKQSKIGNIEELPMDYAIDLDDAYHSYSIDNRNMPFEQPGVQQDNIGIRTFALRPGGSICDAVERIMRLSKQVGEDSMAGTSKTFKTTVTVIRKPTDRYLINIKIRQYCLPTNSESEDTGPGTNPENVPLQFFVNDPTGRSMDVISMKTHLRYDTGDAVMERQVTDSTTAGIVYADREQTTTERLPTVKFFESLHSGNRFMVGSQFIDGLENAELAGNTLNLMARHTYSQNTEYDLVIIGNPNLLSDINRNPQDVIDDVDGSVSYYAKPETEPMYIKLRVYIKSQGDKNAPTVSYYDGYYHVTKITNMFGSIGEGRTFYQHLKIRRTDTLI